MSILVAAALLAAPVAPPPTPPPGLLFGYFRMTVFQQRAKALRCGAGELDRDFDAIVKRLADRYGRNVFTAPRHPSGGPGDCSVILSVYRVNLADFRKQAEAALQAPPPAPAYDPGADPWRNKGFFYYRAHAFRGMVAAQMCGGGDVQRRFDALSARLERARARLAEISHSPAFNPPNMPIPKEPQCSDEKARFTMRGFEDKVRGMEQAAEAGVP
jgi:hypothetical protein